MFDDDFDINTYMLTSLSCVNEKRAEKTLQFLQEQKARQEKTLFSNEEEKKRFPQSPGSP